MRSIVTSSFAPRLHTAAFVFAVVLGTAISSFAQGIVVDANGQVVGGLHSAGLKEFHVAPHAHLNGQAHARFGISGIDSLVNFNGHFFANGVDSAGNPQRHWYWNMVGNPPELGRTTTLQAPVVPVSVDLLDTDGSVRIFNGHVLHSDVGPFVQPTLDSPVFQDSSYTSSDTPTQITDAVQRAEFFNHMRPDWHTRLAPSLKTGRTIQVPSGKYFFALNGDGSCCAFVLIDADTFVNLLFPATASDTTTPVGAAENAGDITTKDVSTFLFPNTYLFIGDVNNCCVLGFHTYDFEPTGNAKVPEKRYVLNYSSWITAGLFGDPEVSDVLATSHEVAETFNDPFVTSDNVHGVTPWWLSPNGNCQNDMEVGDVIEGLPNFTFPVILNGFTYHPQTEALMQWFEFESPSSALNGAYSYPDTSTLTQLSAPQKALCAP